MRQVRQTGFAVAKTMIGIGTLVLSMASGAALAKESPANDCLIGVQNEDGQTLPSSTVTCTDGDSCDADGATDGGCTFRVRGCINIAGVSGCEPRPLKTFKFRVKGEQNVFQVTPVDPGQVSSACGAFVGLRVALKSKGKKPGKRTVTASATAAVKPPGKNKDSDKIVLQCNPCPEASCIPPPTTTTTTVTPTTVTSSTTTTAETSTTTSTTEESTTTTTTEPPTTTSTTETSTTTTSSTTIDGSPTSAFLPAA